MCLYPRMLKNPKYKQNKKNKGIIPEITDARALYVPIGCKNCMECRKQKAREWQTRLLEDIKEHKNGKFITLTFSNESITKLNKDIPEEEMRTRHVEGITKNKEYKITGYERDNEIATKGIRLFLERWRKKYGKSVRHWLITELGGNGTENIHLHGIIWTDESMEEIEKIWGYGFVWKGKVQRNILTGKTTRINYVSDRTINYMIKYVTKIDLKHQQYKSKILTSAGIGSNYTKSQLGDWTKNKFKGKDTLETYRTKTGHKIAMPTYWRNKIYTEKEREELWLIKLDKEERWVGGERVDVSKGEKEYYALLDYYRKVNNQLGYGSDQINWSRKKYEHERRIIMQKARIIYDYPKIWDN